MAQKNDERIMQLKGTIQQKKEALRKKSNRFNPITNCLLVIDKTTYNLHVDCNEMLLVRLNTLKMSADNLGIDTSKFMISGYSLDDWMTDVGNCIEVKKYKDEKKNLDSLEKQLTALLSDDKQTELQIESLAALLQ